jgi:hypothetical protein
MKRIIGIILIIIGVVFPTSMIVQLYTQIDGYGSIWFNLLKILPGDWTVDMITTGTYMISAAIIILGTFLILHRKETSDQ